MKLKISKPNRQNKARKRAQATRKEWLEFVKGTVNEKEIIAKLETLGGL